MEKPKIKFLVDILLFIDFIIISVSGFVLFKILPRGSGKISKSFLFLRETWILIHDWTALILVILVIVHLVLNINFIKYMIKNIFKSKEI